MSLHYEIVPIAVQENCQVAIYPQGRQLHAGILTPVQNKPEHAAVALKHNLMPPPSRKRGQTLGGMADWLPRRRSRS